jgi:hypothetical protein
MSLTIMTASMTIRMVVTALRKREGAASRVVCKLSDMMGRSGCALHGSRRLFGPRCLDFQQ